MQNIQTQFSSISAENWLSILSLAAKPVQEDCFSKTIHNCFTTLSNISLVSKDWKAQQTDERIREPIYNQFVQYLNYTIDASSESSSTDKIKLYIKSLHELKSLYLECIQIHRDTRPNQIVFIACHLHMEKVNVASIWNYANKYVNADMIDYFSVLISKGHFELLGRYLLFKPTVNANQIAEGIVAIKGLTIDRLFLLSLMIKLKFNMKDFFVKYPHYVPELAQLHLYSPCDGIELSDYKASGCIFSNAEFNSPNTSVIHKLLPFFFNLYDDGAFYCPSAYLEPIKNITFTDQKLTKHIRKETCSEIEVKNYILYLLTEANLNLSIICTAIQSLNAGTAISQLRELGKLIEQQPNAISQALEEYDQLEETKFYSQLV